MRKILKFAPVCLMALSSIVGCSEHEHNFDPWEIVEVSTCSKRGIEVRVCKTCGIVNERYLEKIPHTFSDYKKTDETNHTRTCSVCGFQESEEHVWSAQSGLLNKYNCFICQGIKYIPTLVDMQISNSNGTIVKFDNKGAKISSISYNNVVIGENGFVAGRVANRIANATFQLDGVTYNVNKNNGNHCLHGGSKGFGEVNWKKKTQTINSICFELESADGDQGFPGKMNVEVTYTLSDSDELSIEYAAKSDKKTIFNPTNHLYMNLNGIGTNSWRNHSLMINADRYTKADNSLIPTGEIVSVTGTSLDYVQEKTYAGGCDTNLVLNGTGYRKVAEMVGQKTNIKVDVYTDRVGLQLYNDNGHICLEAQDFPDAIHHDNFPSIVLEANANYYSKTSYCFSKLDD